MMKKTTGILLVLASFEAYSQLGGFIGNAVGSSVKDKLKQSATKKIDERLEKQRKEYDESNFNYAICFLDNSGQFEADEKGNSFLGAFKFLTKQEKTAEEQAYSNLKNGELLMAGNKFALAEQSFKLAKLLYETDGKQLTLNYAQTISDLGLLYQSRGRYATAKPYDERAIQLRESGENKGMLVVSINNNAVLKKETGFYTEAEADLKKALGLAKEQNDQLAQALIYNNLAMTYLDMNKMKDAESSMHQSIAQATVVLKDNSSNAIKLQINLANIYRFEKKYSDAEALYLSAIAVKEKKLGAHPDLAQLKTGLAQLYLEMGKTADVEKLLLEAYDIDKKKLGENNPATLSVQQDLANFYRFSNNPAKALELITKVAEQKKIIYGENHPNYIQALEDMALAQWQNNKIAETKANYSLVLNNTLTYINTFFNTLNENEKTLYWDKTNNRLQRFYAFANANAASDADLLKLFYTTVINTKGFLLNNSSKIRSVISASSDTSLRNSYRQWLETKESLNQAYQLSKDELVQEKVNLDSLVRRADELERELSQKSALFRQSANEKPVTIEALQAQLKPTEAVIEIVELNEFKNSGFTGAGSYIALVLTQADLKLVSLGDAAGIQKAVTDFRDKTINRKPEAEAYALTWKPIDAQLKGVTRLYVSSDGAYHQLSINALKDGLKYLADKYAIQFTGNSKDLLDIKQTESLSAKPASAFLVGNPLYGKNEVIEQLPGTETEVKNITKLLNTYKVHTTTLYGAQATEAKVKEINSPGIVHIATHGYFLDDLSQMETSKVLGVDISAAKENPLLRSGVLLAGCENVFDPGFRPSPNSENGVLTAYEAMSLNLDKTELVVLSACETGLGSVKQGEGVYGLQRSFLIAGAKSIIMSLWPVSDDATMELMTLFYTGYAKTGNKQQAFSDALKQLKLKYKEPYYWSAFVMLSK